MSSLSAHSHSLDSEIAMSALDGTQQEDNSSSLAETEDEQLILYFNDKECNILERGEDEIEADTETESITRRQRQRQQLSLRCKECMHWYLSLSLWLRVFGTTIALVIIIDGAILFFVLIGAFGYLSGRMQASILEWSIQIINVCFTSLCLIELPFRFQAMKSWIVLSIRGSDSGDRDSDSDFSHDCSIESVTLHTKTETETETNTGTETETESHIQQNRRQAIMKSYSKPINEHSRWILFGIIHFLKIFQIVCQCWVEYLCLAYIGHQHQRPSLLFAVAVGLALPLGCGLGCLEGCLKS
jgi:hypothetical protein